MLHHINAAPVIVEHNYPLLKAAQKLVAARASCLLVVDDHNLITGIVTRGDLVTALVKNLRKTAQQNLNNVAIASIMSKPVEFIYFDDMYQGIERLYRTEKIEHFPLLRNHGPPTLSNLVGILKYSNVVQCYFSKQSHLLQTKDLLQ